MRFATAMSEIVAPVAPGIAFFRFGAFDTAFRTLNLPTELIGQAFDSGASLRGQSCYQLCEFVRRRMQSWFVSRGATVRWNGLKGDPHPHSRSRCKSLERTC